MNEICDSEWYEKKTLGRAVKLLKNANGNQAVIKKPVSCSSIITRAVRLLFPGGGPFRNEVRINRILKSIETSHFKFPRAIEVKPHSLLFEFIEGCNEIRSRGKYEDEIMHGIHEFSKLSSLIKQPVIEALYLSLLESPAFVCLRILSRLNISFDNKFKYAVKFIRLYYSLPVYSPVLLHNDLSNSNIFVDNFGTIFFMDFEDCITERRAIFMDYIDAFNFQREISYKTLEKLCSMHELNIKNNKSYNNILRMIHACYFKSIVRKLISKKTSLSEMEIIKSIMNDVVECQYLIIIK